MSPPAPGNLGRLLDLVCYLRRQDDTIDVEPPAKPAAKQMVVDYYRFERQGRHVGFCLSRPPGDLGSHPDFAFVVTDMHGTIHRLHRRVRLDRHAINELMYRAALCLRHHYIALVDIRQRFAVDCIFHAALQID